MKINRYSLITVLALALGGSLAASNLALAQDTNAAVKAPRRPSPDQQLERLNTELNLTEAQKPKVKELLENGAKQRRELRGLAQDERREKTRTLNEEQNKKFKELLTPEQYDKFKKLMEQRGQRRGGANNNQKSDSQKSTTSN